MRALVHLLVRRTLALAGTKALLARRRTAVVLARRPVPVLADANLQVLQLQEALKVRRRRRRVGRRARRRMPSRKALVCRARRLLPLPVDAHGTGGRALGVARTARTGRVPVAR